MTRLKKTLAIISALLLLTPITLTACGKEHTHTWELAQTVTPSTCTTKGTGKYRCECGETQTQELPLDVNAHHYTWTETEAATCGKAGKESGVCSHNSAHTTTRETPKAEHDWEWTLVSPATCTEDGKKSGVCNKDPTHVESNGVIQKRGHEYDDGVCIRCNNAPTLPQPPADIVYVDLYDLEEETTKVECGGVNMYQLSLGYYTLTIDTQSDGLDGGTWISVALPEAGQYAIFSTDNNASNVTVTQYDASVAYVNPNGDKGVVLADGNLYSDYHCSRKHWNESSRATWRLECDEFAQINVAIVRIADPAWQPESIYKTIKPKQLNATEAPDGESNAQLKEVPYNTEYFYDETCGYYRRGTASTPGEIIQVAITKVPERLLSEKPFTEIQNDGNNLTLPYQQDADGNYVARDYSAFIDADASHDNNCYENYVNSDGVYPVNQELFEFLNLYVKKHKPYDIPESIWNNETLRTEQAWLSACYYYTADEIGKENNPLVISQAGEFAIKTYRRNKYYCTIAYEPEIVDGEIIDVESCTLTWSETANIAVIVNGNTYKTSDGYTSVTFENGSTISIAATTYNSDNETPTFLFTLSVQLTQND